jgi:hypothetical protein
LNSHNLIRATWVFPCTDRFATEKGIPRARKSELPH